MNNKALVRAGQKIRVTCIFILLFMVLSRLTWLQIRILQDAPESPSFFAATLAEIDCRDFANDQSSDSVSHHDHVNSAALAPVLPMLLKSLTCARLVRPEITVVHLNRWFFVLTVLIVVLITRSITGSWMGSLLVGAVIMSRGAFLARVSEPSLNLLMAFLVTLWVGATVHFFRTGATISLAVGVLTSILATAFAPGTIVLALVIPFLVLLVFRDKSDRRRVPLRTQIERRGNLFLTLRIPFLSWLHHQQRDTRLILGWLLVFFGTGVIFVVAKALAVPGFFAILGQIHWDNPSLHLLTPWWQLIAAPLDFHYMVSLGAIIGGLRLRLGDNPSNLAECAWLIVVATVFLLVASLGECLILGGINTTFVHRDLDRVLEWLEPAVIAFAVIIIYHMIRSNAAAYQKKIHWEYSAPAEKPSGD